ncbi:hypothetical protein Cylst_5559 [Cylindrospermum stagnale PCC 7417]|uniref:Pepco domain-containing protein n=1 Tax=Cylindrospermum stagnale PCC 7417 TaxID=56107 RepID=K9X539_9NOST|nr:hypothetical protein [Cylindrospermum stagnale]AFZ27568.1 hypothetical protein Cylst_5559 [Cylindrospermum stagnale PCC 7417]
MSEEISTPKTIWIVTEEVAETSTTTREISTITGDRGGVDRGGIIGRRTAEEEIIITKEKDKVVITRRKALEVNQLKLQMKGFLQAMREMLDEADEPDSKIQLDEVEVAVEINGEGQFSLLGVGGKAGGKGSMTFKFKRK